ncbi:MAG: catechol 2,3-dioxygenase-like lactoylglutathione lyase family enzyme [Saprospiraceae bacterium]|jgi:catechol 2,3-dioxygenase-like lactoylglutathione lyase family enzyme
MNLNQITVPVLDIPKSIKFYQTLGLKLIVESPHYARFECPDGEATFSLHITDKLPEGDGISVYFECEDLDNKVAELVKKGIEFDELPNDKRWLWREAHLRDPDNNHVILFYGGENRKDPPWKIKE